MSDKPVFMRDFDDIVAEISKARSETDIQKILKQAAANPELDQQALNTTALGNLMEQKYGAGDVKTTDSLNDFLQKIKSSDYQNIDDIRKIIYKDAKPIEASFQRGGFGNGVSYANPAMEKPIRIGDTPMGYDYSNARAKAILGHEMSHSNDTPAIHLKRMKDAMDPSEYGEIVKRIGDLGEGGEKFLEHSKNIADRYPTQNANFLTPEKLDQFREALMNEAPSSQRAEHLQLLNKYEDALGKNLALTPDKALMKSHIGVDPAKLKTMPGEAIHFTPDRDYMTKVMEKTMSPGEAESLRSTGHHAIRTDIPDDVGHYEARNIKRLASGKGLLGIAPVLGMAANVVPSLVDMKEGNPNTAAARMVTGLAPAGTGELDQKLLKQAEIADKSPELQDPGYMQTLKNIGERRAREGKNPVVESFSGQQIDTSATEPSDFMNEVKRKMRENSNG